MRQECAVDERHVEFSADVVGVDSADRESTRLQRRDTPHHLKNKRVNTTPPHTGSSDDDSAEQVTQKMSFCFCVECFVK